MMVKILPVVLFTNDLIPKNFASFQIPQYTSNVEVLDVSVG